MARSFSLLCLLFPGEALKLLSGEISLKKIAIFTNGTRGDVQPLIYLAVALKREGFSPVIAASGNFKKLVEDEGLEHVSMPVNLQDYMNSPEGKDWLRGLKSNPFTMISKLKAKTKDLAEGTLKSYWYAAQGSSIIITSPGAIGDLIMSRELQIPLVEVQLQPLVPTGDFSYPLLSGDPRFKNLRKTMFYLMEKVLWSLFRKDIVKWQKNQFQKVTRLSGGIFKQRRLCSDAIIGAYSPHLVEKPSDWPPNTSIAGFYLPVESSEKEEILNQEILDFLNSGAKPLYLGFGSIAQSSLSHVKKLIQIILDCTDERIIFNSGWTEADDLGSKDRLLVIKEANHHKLFPLCTVLIHHGGAGTTAAALNSGTPQILYPFMADQPFWARQLYKKGLIPESFPLKRVNQKRFQQQYSFATSKKTISHCKDFSEIIENENGIEKTLSMIQSLL